MDIDLLRGKFGRMGARLRVTDIPTPDRRGTGIDIGADSLGEYFDIRLNANEQVAYEVVDLRPNMRHLLLLARRDRGQKEKYLCGHDERHWFVCAVPDSRGVASVAAALEALQPPEVRAAVGRALRRPKERMRRHNRAFIRQGEMNTEHEPPASRNVVFLD